MKECVLVVDDDREIVRAIALLLEKEGYKVLKAYDGMQALEMVAQQVQLIIMDVMMPKLDGLSAVMKIREIKNIPIIVLSAKSEDTDKILGLWGRMTMWQNRIIRQNWWPESKAIFAGTRAWGISIHPSPLPML